MTPPRFFPFALALAASLSGGCRCDAGGAGGAGAPAASTPPPAPDPSPWRVAFEGACVLRGVSAIEGATFVHLSPPRPRSCGGGEPSEKKAVPPEDQAALRWTPEGAVDRSASTFAGDVYGRWPREAFVRARGGRDDGIGYTHDLRRWEGDHYRPTLAFTRYSHDDPSPSRPGAAAALRGPRVFQEEPVDVLPWGEGRWVALVQASGENVPFERLSFRPLDGAGPAPSLQGLPVSQQDLVDVASRRGRELVALVVPAPSLDTKDHSVRPAWLARWENRAPRVERIGPTVEWATLVRGPAGALYVRHAPAPGADSDRLREVIDGGLGPPLTLPPQTRELRVGPDGSFWALTAGERVLRWAPGASSWQDTAAPGAEGPCEPKALAPKVPALNGAADDRRLVPVEGAIWFRTRGGQAYVLREGGAWAPALAPRSLGAAVCVEALWPGEGGQVWAAVSERYDEPPCPRPDEPAPPAPSKPARRYVLTTAPVAAPLACDERALRDAAGASVSELR